MIEKINETKSWFLEKSDKIDESLCRMTKKKREIFKLVESEIKEGTLVLSLYRNKNYKGIP